MKQYFIANPDIARNEQFLSFDYAGFPFRLTTTAGLFSYEKPDAASLLLIDVMRKSLPPLAGNVLDLGCGYGLIGILMAKTHAAQHGFRLFMSDTNEIACTYAKKNAQAHHIPVTVIHSDGFAQINDKFNHITLNPPIHAGKETMYRLYQECADALLPNGTLYIVIQKKHGALTTQNFLSTIFKSITILHKHKGFYVLSCTC